jgi:hypothetical protein
VHKRTITMKLAGYPRANKSINVHASNKIQS